MRPCSWVLFHAIIEHTFDSGDENMRRNSMQGIDLRKKGKKKSPQRGSRSRRYSCHYGIENSISVDFLKSNDELTYDDVVCDFLKRIVDQQKDIDIKGMLSLLKDNLR